MGPANQPISKETQQGFQQQHISSKHPRFLNAKIASFNDQMTYFEVTQSIGNILSYNTWERTLQQIKKKIGPNSLYLPLECEYQQQGLCGSAGILKFKFQYFPFLLDEQITNRQFKSLPFEQKQLWFLLYILVQTAAALHSLGELVGDIRPKNVFINQSGDVSVYNKLSFPQEFSNFQKVRYFNQSNYLCPEGVNNIHTGKQIPTYDQKIGQSFSIGLTILDAIFLTDHSFLYDKMQRFNEIAFLKIMERLQNSSLNQKLKNVLILMLSINPEKRLSCIDLCEYLTPYEKQIFELQDFQIKGQLKGQFISQKNESQSPVKSVQKQSRRSRRQNLIRYSLSRSDKKNVKVDEQIQGERLISNKQEISINNKNQGQNSNNKNQGLNRQSISNNNIKGVQQSNRMRSYNNFSNEAQSSSSIKNIQRENQANENKNVNNNQFRQQQNNRFKNVQLQERNINKKQIDQTKNNEYINKQFYKIQKPDNHKQYFQTYAETQSLQNVSPYFKISNDKIQNNLKQSNNMIFKTGNLFLKQRTSAPIIQTNNDSLNIGPLYNNNTTYHESQSVYNQYKINNDYKQNNQYKLNNQYKQNNQYKLNNNFKPIVDYTLTSNTSSSNQYNDFLKQIDKQIEQSKKLFPDSFQ